jgi:hypothetical protein
MNYQLNRDRDSSLNYFVNPQRFLDQDFVKIGKSCHVPHRLQPAKSRKMRGVGNRGRLFYQDGFQLIVTRMR